MSSLRLCVLFVLAACGHGNQTTPPATTPAKVESPMLVMRDEQLLVTGMSQILERGRRLYVLDEEGQLNVGLVDVQEVAVDDGGPYRVAWLCRPAHKDYQRLKRSGLPVKIVRPEAGIRVGKCWGQYEPAEQPKQLPLPPDAPLDLILQLGSGVGVENNDIYEVLGAPQLDDQERSVTDHERIAQCTVTSFEVRTAIARCQVNRKEWPDFSDAQYLAGGFVQYLPRSTPCAESAGPNGPHFCRDPNDGDYVVGLKEEHGWRRNDYVTLKTQPSMGPVALLRVLRAHENAVEVTLIDARHEPLQHLFAEHHGQQAPPQYRHFFGKVTHKGGGQLTLDLGSDDGVEQGYVYDLLDTGVDFTVARVAVVQATATDSIVQIVEDQQGRGIAKLSGLRARFCSPTPPRTEHDSSTRRPGWLISAASGVVVGALGFGLWWRAGKLTDELDGDCFDENGCSDGAIDETEQRVQRLDRAGLSLTYAGFSVATVGVLAYFLHPRDLSDTRSSRSFPSRALTFSPAASQDRVGLVSRLTF